MSQENTVRVTGCNQGKASLLPSPFPSNKLKHGSEFLKSGAWRWGSRWTTYTRILLQFDSWRESFTSGFNSAFKLLVLINGESVEVATGGGEVCHTLALHLCLHVFGCWRNAEKKSSCYLQISALNSLKN